MSGINTESLEAALGGAFGDPPVKAEPAKVAAPKAERIAEPDEVDEPAPDVTEADPADLLDAEVETAEPPKTEAELVFEFELDGKPERIEGKARVQELLTRGLKAGRGFEENARIREALNAHGQQMQLQQAFHQAASGDIASIQALDQQLEHFQKMDWPQMWESDPFNAMKVKEQRDQLKEQRAAAVQNFNAKQQHFQAQFRENTQRMVAAENEALLAKVPAWRNNEKAKQEQSEIAGVLASHYGFTSAEIGNLIDHRHLLVARDAAAYRKLLASKEQRVKQAREAPVTAKPGTAAQTNSRTEFQKAKGLLKAHGAKGNHRAQENIAVAMFEKAFK